MKKALIAVLCIIILIVCVGCGDNQSTDIECSNCGAKISTEAKFCSSCGKTILDSPNEDNKKDESNNDNSEKNDNTSGNTNSDQNQSNNDNDDQNNDNNEPQKTELEKAIEDANALVEAYFDEYPNDYLIPLHIIENLMNWDYSEDVAIQAANSCNVDWITQANKSASNYLNYEISFGNPADWLDKPGIEDILKEECFSTQTINSVLSKIDWENQKQKYLLHLIVCDGIFYENIPNRYELISYLVEINIVTSNLSAKKLINSTSINWTDYANAMALQIWNENNGETNKSVDEINDLIGIIEEELSETWQYTTIEIQDAISQFDAFLEIENYSQGLTYAAVQGGYAVSGIGTCADINIIVPRSYNGKPVIAISDNAFEYSENITSIYLPSSVKKIGACAFMYSSIKHFKSAYGLETIGDNAFQSCSKLVEIDIPGSVTKIGYYAFAFCTSLVDIVVDESNNSYKSINGNLYTKDGTVLLQYSLGKTEKTFSIPNSVLRIGDDAFSFCSNIQTVIIPDEVTRIGSYAFAYCDNLRKIVVGEGVKTIGSYAFTGCPKLTIYCKQIEEPDSLNGDWNYNYWDSKEINVIWNYKD